MSEYGQRPVDVEPACADENYKHYIKLIKMSECKTLYNFLKRAKRFSHENTYTSTLKVDKNNTVEDLREHFGTKIGGIIAGIDNDVSEAIYAAIEYFEQTGDKRSINKFKELQEKKYGMGNR